MVLTALLLACPGRAEDELPPDPGGTAGNFGGMGLLETRNARLRPDGTLEAGASVRRQRRFYWVNFQALPFLETTFRLSERLDATTGRGTTTDRSLDVKLRLLEEGQHHPAVAIGLQDVVGTGIYGGEYVVASRRWHGLDLSLGLGFGRLGTGRDIENPLTFLSDRFAARPRDVGRGGTPRLDVFRGRDVALLGGVQYDLPTVPTPWGEVDGLRATVEYSGDALRDERGGFPVRRGAPRGEARSRWNAGLSWTGQHVDAGLSFTHGTDLLFRLSLRMDPARPPAAAPLRPVPPMPPRTAAATLPAGDAPRPATGETDGDEVPPDPVTGIVPWRDRAASRPDRTAARPVASRTVLAADAGPIGDADRPPPAEADRARAVFAALEAAGLRPLAYAEAEGEARIAVAEGGFRTLPQVASRVLRATNAILPAEAGMLRVSWWSAGVEIGALAVPRASLEAAATRGASVEEAWGATTILPAEGAPWSAATRNPGPHLDWDLGPRLDLVLGDPSRSVRYQVAGAAGARLSLDGGWAIAGAVRQVAFGNLDGGLPSDSALPRVRSDYALYARDGKTSIPALYGERIWNVAPDIFARATAGLLEPMFGGVSAEVLWRPVDRPFAVGLDLNVVRQRETDGLLRFRPYSVVTGHVSLYADLPVWNLYAVVRAGRYLAGDWGGTLEVGRRFDSGIEVGGFATLTNVPFSRFGEGSFDKGIYVRVPLDLFGGTTRGVGVALIRPVQRDGGQRLAVDNPLWELTRDGRTDAARRGIAGYAR